MTDEFAGGKGKHPRCSNSVLDRAAKDYKKGLHRQENLDRICECLRPELKSFFVRKGVAQDAEDLAQETLVKVSTDLNKFRSECCLRTWVRHISVSTFLRHIGKLADTDSLDELQKQGWDVEDLGDSPEVSARRKELAARVRHAVAELTPQRRACVELRFYQDRSYKEISEILGIRIGTVGPTLRQACETLTKVLGPEIDIDERDFDDLD